ncbi:MAG TPA: phosphoribosylformylglycinamidine synthase subunit PurL, partial [Candidatus Dormibacteraeota bacterium]
MRSAPADTRPSPAELAELALTEAEYHSACAQLERSPNRLELGMLGALWSEHCSYKTSRALLRQLPSKGERVVQGPGENAGVLDLGQDLLCCFKIESHNHPSAVEPVQGAATGVGGILRDVFAMGARPVALLDGIRFGDLGEPGQRQRFARVVEGIGWYGNCVGVPTVGGETHFDAPYRHNCLVNAMCVGLTSPQHLLRARASGPGNPVLLVGAGTGRDGIHGATFASVQLDQAAETRRPAVQVGNPFLEKCLLEACLELAGDPDLIGLQDCGAAGLTSSCAEMADRGGVGLEIDVARVSRREAGMTPYEVMLSESQERMVLVVRRGSEERFRASFERWGLHSDVIGQVTEEPVFQIREGGREVASLPLEVLVSGFPERHPKAVAPDLSRELAADPLARTPPWSAAEAWLRLLGSPNCADLTWVWRQYDH